MIRKKSNVKVFDTHRSAEEERRVDHRALRTARGRKLTLRPIKHWHDSVWIRGSGARSGGDTLMPCLIDPSSTAKSKWATSTHRTRAR